MPWQDYLLLIEHRKGSVLQKLVFSFASALFTVSEKWLLVANSNFSRWRSTLFAVLFVHVPLLCNVYLWAGLLFKLKCSNGDASGTDIIQSTRRFSITRFKRRKLSLNRLELRCLLKVYTKHLLNFQLGAAAPKAFAHFITFIATICQSNHLPVKRCMKFCQGSILYFPCAIFTHC